MKRARAHLHLILAIVWILLVVPTVVVWNSSILWIAFMSIYAIVVSHLAAWHARKAQR